MVKIKTMNIAVCLDENFVMPTTVMLESLGQNNTTECVNVFCVSEKMLCEDSRKILKDECSKFGFTIYFFDYNLSDREKLRNANTGRWSLAAYLKLYLSEVLPKDIDKVIFLDGDIIVRHNLAELWSTNVEGKALAGVRDAAETWSAIEQTIRFDHHKYGYINTGVLVYNMKFMREHNMCTQFDQYIYENGQNIGFVDQDVFNNVLYRHIKYLDVKYNVHFYSFLHKSKNFIFTDKEEKNRAYRNPYVIHYTTALKPWFKWCANPYKKEWDKYCKLTQYKGIRKTLRTNRLYLKIFYCFIKPFNDFRYL